MHDLISIVIATYNRAHSLSRAIKSVLAQTDTDWELIVVDDGSNDDTASTVQNFDDRRIRYIKLPANGGASAARNRGIAEARGTWVMVWDSDDELYPHALEALRKHAADNPDCIVISAPARMVRDGAAIQMPRHPSGPVSLEQVLCKYVGNDEKIRLARRDAYLKASYVSRNIDFVVGARLRAQGGWFHADEPLGDVFIDNPDSLTRQRQRFDSARSADRAPHLDAFFVDFGPFLKRSCRKRYAQLSYGASIACACAGMKKKARHYALESITSDPLSVRAYGALLFSILFPRR